MSNEINILNYIYENENVTQRDIASYAGMSVGGVNLLLKKMVTIGFVRIEALKSPKVVKYILTPEGLKEKMEKTYHFITHNYKQILRVRQVIALILKDILKEYRIIYLYGQKDEVYEIIQMVIHEEFGNRSKQIRYICSFNEIQESFKRKIGEVVVGSIVLVWGYNYGNMMKRNDIQFVNLLESIRIEID